MFESTALVARWYGFENQCHARDATFEKFYVQACIQLHAQLPEDMECLVA